MDTRKLSALCDDLYETGRQDHDNACDGRAVQESTITALRSAAFLECGDATPADVRDMVRAWRDGWDAAHKRGCCDAE